MKCQPASEVDTSVDAYRCSSVNLSKKEIGARFKVARKAVGLTQDALAALAGATSKRGLQDNEAGDTMPGGQMIGALVHAGINANWLLTGEGPMLLADLAPKPASPLVNVPALSAIIRGLIEAGAPAEKVGPTAWRYYTDAIEQGLITPDGIGEGGKAAA